MKMFSSFNVTNPDLRFKLLAELAEFSIRAVGSRLSAISTIRPISETGLLWGGPFKIVGSVFRHHPGSGMLKRKIASAEGKQKPLRGRGLLSSYVSHLTLAEGYSDIHVV